MEAQLFDIRRKRRKDADLLLRKGYELRRSAMDAVIKRLLEEGKTLSLWGAPLDCSYSREDAFLSVFDSEESPFSRIWVGPDGAVKLQSGDTVSTVYDGSSLAVFIFGVLDTEYYIQRELQKQLEGFEVINIEDVLWRCCDAGGIGERPCRLDFRQIANAFAAMVILYNPPSDIVESVRSYSRSLGKVYAYDNSPDHNEYLQKVVESLGNVEYVFGGGENRGICYPINAIAQRALDEGYDWLMTFDQDSVAGDGMVETMAEYAFHNRESRIRVIAPLPYTGKDDYDADVRLPYASGVNFTIQSGLMHDLRLFREGIRYDERLFIDEVDNEYCV